jgi:hypothetical protein
VVIVDIKFIMLCTISLQSRFYSIPRVARYLRDDRGGRAVPTCRLVSYFAIRLGKYLAFTFVFVYGEIKFGQLVKNERGKFL